MPRRNIAPNTQRIRNKLNEKVEAMRKQGKTLSAIKKELKIKHGQELRAMRALKIIDNAISKSKEKRTK